MLLALAAFIWGTAFVAQSLGMDHLGPCTFNAVRSFIGGFALLPVAVLSAKMKKGLGKTEKLPFFQAHKSLFISGTLCGLLLGTASLFQQAGIQFTTAGKAGFLTALYIVIVPVLGLIWGQKPGAFVWIAVAVCVAGAWCLSVTEDFSIAPGDLMVLLCAFLFALHILAVDRTPSQVDGVALSCVQFFVAGILSTIVALCRESFVLEDVLKTWAPLLYTGVLSSGVAYTLQILGQRNMNPTVASLILSLESVFAALTGWLILHEPLSPREILGCGLVFFGVIMAQLPSPGKKKRELVKIKSDRKEEGPCA